jgi:hypothetical protein
MAEVILQPNSEAVFSDEKLHFRSDLNEKSTTFTLGRGTKGLQIDDKKCSRHQAQLTVHQTGLVELCWVWQLILTIIYPRLELILCYFKEEGLAVRLI